MASLFRPSYRDKATGKARRLKKWYGKYADASGAIQRVPLSTNKVVAQQMLGHLLGQVEKDRAGIVDPHAAHRGRPLADHVTEWEAALLAGGATEKHSRQTTACVRRVFEACGFNFIADLSGSPVQAYLAGLKSDTPAVALPDGEWFTKQQICELLDSNKVAVSKLIARHRVRAEGNGRARKYHRDGVARLLARSARGRGTGTVNHTLAAVKQFARWLVIDRRTPDNPLAHLKGGNVKADRRLHRRILSEADLRAVIESARTSPRRYRGLTGPDRAAIYLTACVSGFRAGELAVLTPEDFELATGTPTVRLAPGESKNDAEAIQPLPPEVAAELREYLASRPAGQPVWPGTWARKAADMLRIDLETAGIPFEVVDHGVPLVADFHALRHSYIVLLDAAGATLREAMQLARHSDPKLTMAVYGKLRTSDLGKTVERLPNLAVRGSETGSRHCPKHVPTGGGTGRPETAPDGVGVLASGEADYGNAVKDGGLQRNEAKSETPREGFEPITAELTCEERMLQVIPCKSLACEQRDQRMRSILVRELPSSIDRVVEVDSSRSCD